MSKVSLVKGTTSYLARVFFRDSSSTTGAGLTGLTSGSSGLVCYRARDDDGNAGGTAIALSGGTRGTWSSGGFVEKDATNMPGWYEFGVTNASLVTGSKTVAFHFKGATNLAPCPIEIELTGVDNQDAVHGGMSAIPNASPGAANGVLIAGTNAATTFTSAAGDALTISSTGTNGSGLKVSGNGTGDGIQATGGATGRGLHCIGGATSGAGIRAEGTAGNSSGFEGAGQGSQDGMQLTGGATGRGLHCVGGASSGAGIRSEGTAGNANAIEGTGIGSGAGLGATGGAIGSGIIGTGAAAGINAVGTGSGDGLLATGAGTGHGISAGSGTGATGNGINAASNATAGNGMTLVHAGTGKDLNATTTPLTLAKTTNITGFNDIAAGTQMDLVNAPNATAITAIQNGLGTSANQTTINNNVLAIPGQVTTDHGSGSYLTATTVSVNGIDATTANKIADHARRRTQANAEASSNGDALDVHSEYGMIQQVQKSSTLTHAGKLTVFKTDGTTELAQETITTDAAAEPITSVA